MVVMVAMIVPVGMIMVVMMIVAVLVAVRCIILSRKPDASAFSPAAAELCAKRAEVQQSCAGAESACGCWMHRDHYTIHPRADCLHDHPGKTARTDHAIGEP